MDATYEDLLEKIEANPDDMVLKIAFADFLEENGEEDKARFIRLALDGFYNEAFSYISEDFEYDDEQGFNWQLESAGSKVFGCSYVAIKRTRNCEEEVESSLLDRLHDLYRIWRAYARGRETTSDGLSIYEYGLAFDYVEPDGDRGGYWRYQLSWGGPSEEFRLNDAGDIEFWYLDWYDGARREVNDRVIREIFDWFLEARGSSETSEEAPWG